jgi:hypothetical protein
MAGGEEKETPFDAVCGVAQDRLRQAQGERLCERLVRAHGSPAIPAKGDMPTDGVGIL